MWTLNYLLFCKCTGRVFFGIKSLFSPLPTVHAPANYHPSSPSSVPHFVKTSDWQILFWLKKKKKLHSVHSANSSSSVCYSLQLTPGLQSPVGFIFPPITTRCGLAPWSPCQERAGGQPQLVGKAAHERRNEMKWDKWRREGAARRGCCVDVVKNTSRNNPIGTAELLKIARSRREEMRGLLYFFVQGYKNRMARKKNK